ncbi:MAG: hypothetical protein Q9176_005473 [Flavoplaca citrina]
MARRHGGGRGGHDDGRPVYIDDGHGGCILDLSVPRLAGEPRPGPWHQIMFEAMGGPHRCNHPEQGCHTGGGCEAMLRQELLAQAVSEGYQGPPDPRQVREFTMPHYDEIVEGVLESAKPDRVILPGDMATKEVVTGVVAAVEATVQVVDMAVEEATVQVVDMPVKGPEIMDIQRETVAAKEAIVQGVDMPVEGAEVMDIQRDTAVAKEAMVHAVDVAAEEATVQAVDMAVEVASRA